jgi:hypothetical protein
MNGIRKITQVAHMERVRIGINGSGNDGLDRP